MAAPTIAQFRTAHGIGTGDSPQFTGIELGHATANTLTASSGDLSIEGNVVYRAGGTDVPVTDGGTGRSTGTTAYALVATGTTATGAQQTLASGATTEVLVGGGAAALPVWTTAQGSGAPVRATSPTLTTPNLGTPSAGTLTNCTGLPVAGITASTATALGVGSIELGHATANTLTGSSGDLSIEGNVVYRAGGTDVPVTDGGTGRSTSTTAYALIAAGTTATGAHQTLAAGATTEILVGGGASALPVWTTAQGSGAPVRATSPTLTTPNLGTPSAVNLTNGTALPVAGITASTSTALGVGSIELGHASDTTIARTAAGRATIEGAEIVRSSTSQGGTGATVIQNVVGISQTDYNALGTPNSTTLYVITGA